MRQPEGAGKCVFAWGIQRNCRNQEIFIYYNHAEQFCSTTEQYRGVEKSAAAIWEFIWAPRVAVVCAVAAGHKTRI